MTVLAGRMRSERCVIVAVLWVSGAAKRHCPAKDGVRDRINSTHDLTYSAVIGSL